MDFAATRRNQSGSQQLTALPAKATPRIGGNSNGRCMTEPCSFPLVLPVHLIGTIKCWYGVPAHIT